MFDRLKDFVASRRPLADIGAVSLTEYFDDTVKNIARANMKKMLTQDVPKDLINPDSVACLLYLGGEKVAAQQNRMMEQEIYNDMRKPQSPVRVLLQDGREGAPSSKTNHDMIKTAFNIEDGVLAFCDVSRKEYGLEIASVYYRPDEIKEKFTL